MTKLYPISPSLTSFPASLSEHKPPCRLIVLVPEADVDYAAATRRVWELANELGVGIQFIGLCGEPAQEPSLRRQLVTMTAMLYYGNITAKAKVEVGNNWVDVVKSNRQAGDMVVCFAEQHAGLLHRPVSQILRSNLDIPIYILTGLYTQSTSRFNRLSILALWLGWIGIIAGSFLLQIRIISMSQDWTQTTLLIFSAMAELWLIWVWNNLFS